MAEDQTPVPEAPQPSAKRPRAKATKRTGKARRRAAAVKLPAKKKGRSGGPRRPFPAVTLEDALPLPRALREHNGGNPWPPDALASALGLSKKADRFYYLSAGARDYGLTVGTRSAPQIELADLGREIAYATTPQVEIDGLRKAFFKIEVFKKVYEYYKGSALPDPQYLQNTLEAVFSLSPEYHAEFVSVYSANLSFLQASETRLAARGRRAIPTRIRP